ncbi:hypothetical protein, partial [Mesorhizobium sp. M1C.F.Ca.ET.212.01.1.1]|uniref:hypothetical protein n=1 Tax=Mesorhizobium sp. M1C.F.Ca.ET.212.01.1.1 TaxID=2500527 RepID=UPI001AED87AB
AVDAGAYEAKSLLHRPQRWDKFSRSLMLGNDPHRAEGDSDSYGLRRVRIGINNQTDLGERSTNSSNGSDSWFCALSAEA